MVRNDIAVKAKDRQTVQFRLFRGDSLRVSVVDEDGASARYAFFVLSKSTMPVLLSRLKCNSALQLLPRLCRQWNETFYSLTF